MPHVQVTMRWDGPGSPCRTRDLWIRLRCALRGVLGAALLPQQAQLVLHGVAIEEVDAALQGVGRRAGLRGLQVECRRLADDPRALSQELAAVHAAPTCVSRIGDLLEWPWSTARDVLGTMIDPWVTPAILSSALRDDAATHEVLRGLERGGAIGRAEAGDTPAVPLREVLRAAAAATRRPISAVRRPSPTRRLFVALAHRHGWWAPGHLASICEVTRRSLYKSLQRVPEAWLDAGALCLGDDRLRARVLPSPVGTAPVGLHGAPSHVGEGVPALTFPDPSVGLVGRDPGRPTGGEPQTSRGGTQPARATASENF